MFLFKIQWLLLQKCSFWLLYSNNTVYSLFFEQIETFQIKFSQFVELFRQIKK